MYCSFILFIGAFFEAYIMGGLTTEMSKSLQKDDEMNRDIDYISYSMDSHKFP